MGQWRRKAHEGKIYLVEDVEDAMRLEVSQPEHFAYTTQTTLSVDETRDVIAALRQRFPQIQGPRHDDICYATQNRQDAVRELAAQCDLILVVGSVNSSNSNRLRELAEKNGARAYLIDGAWISSRNGWSAPKDRCHCRCIGAGSAGAGRHLAICRHWAGGSVTELDGEPENMVFALPKELRVKLID